MYLINVRTMELDFFQDDRIVVYGILSHRWQQDEVSFQDMRTRTGKNKAGYTKLKRFCEIVAQDKYDYAWCDTCCIDKGSSAELSESINSMFRWYQNSAKCYAYLFDVESANIDDPDSDFRKSEWFTRGWCLQELIAPQSLTFFNTAWESLGTKDTLSQVISEITGIHPKALDGLDLEDFSVAQRMSWASDRITSRVEDVAYSLLGIFGVNMPLLYGEGERAFLRIQEEIMKQSSDQSILVHASSRSHQGVLATSPADFRDSFGIIRSERPLIRKPYSLTNMGLSIELLLYPWSLGVFMALLDCRNESAPDSHVALYLRLDPQLRDQDDSAMADVVTRIKIDNQAWTSRPQISNLPRIRKSLYLDHKRPVHSPIPLETNGYYIRRFEGLNSWAKAGKLSALSWNEWSSTERILEIPPGIQRTVGILMLDIEDDGDGQPCHVPLRLGFTPTFEPIIEFASRALQRGLRPPYDRSKADDFLSDIDWRQMSDPRRGAGILMYGKGRDAPIRTREVWAWRGAVTIIAEKTLVNDRKTWTLDITWRMGSKGLLDDVERDVTVVCDGCNNVSTMNVLFTFGLAELTAPKEISETRHKCLTCDDFDLCSSCFGKAEKIHDRVHEFVRMG